MEAKKRGSRYWWFESHNNCPIRSHWLQSTLAELDEKTSSMLHIIEEDADSFAQRAEMYYKKRPELISIVEDFYRVHRSLAERYDQVKSDCGTRATRQGVSSPLPFKYQGEKSMMTPEKSYDTYSETYDPEESGGSEVDDPEEEEIEINKEIEEEEVSSGIGNGEAMMMTLREEIEKLKEENRIQKEQLMQKDEEKREVIRQLSSTVDLLKEDNVRLRNHIAKKSPSPKNRHPLESSKLKTSFLGMLFNGAPKTHAIVAPNKELIELK